jgi:hypothetical protein
MGRIVRDHNGRRPLTASLAALSLTASATLLSSVAPSYAAPGCEDADITSNTSIAQLRAESAVLCLINAERSSRSLRTLMRHPIRKRLRQQQGNSVGHVRDLVDLAIGGDPEARRLIRESGRHIGEVLAGAVNLLNPEALVIAGDMSKAYDILAAGLRETVYGNATALATRELQILPSTHGDQSGVIGSAAMILDHVLSARAVDAAL